MFWTLTASAKNSIADFPQTKFRPSIIYLNEAYFGNDTFGIESGALLYVHKHARELSLSESALLVAIIWSPRRYSPLKSLDAAKARRNQVLDRMAAQKLISADDAGRAKADPVPTT